MKTRIIKTRFWSDPKVHSLNSDSRYILLSLLTSTEINLIGCFEMSTHNLSFLTGKTENECKEALVELERAGLIESQGNWIFVPNAPKHNRYWAIPTNEEGVNAELLQVPEPLRTSVYNTIINIIDDSSMGTSMGTTLKYKIKNLKDKKENKKESGEGTDTLPVFDSDEVRQVVDSMVK